MKLPLTTSCRSHARQRGSAVLVVLVFLACIGMLLYSNSKTLHLLAMELNLVEQKQQARYGQKPPAPVPQKPVSAERQ